MPANPRGELLVGSLPGREGKHLHDGFGTIEFQTDAVELQKGAQSDPSDAFVPVHEWMVVRY